MLLHSMNTHKHKNKEKLSIKKSLTIETYIKSRLHCIDIIAYHYIYLNCSLGVNNNHNFNFFLQMPILTFQF